MSVIHCSTTEHETRDRHGLRVLTDQYNPLPPGVRDLEYWTRWLQTPDGRTPLSLVRLDWEEPQ